MLSLMFPAAAFTYSPACHVDMRGFSFRPSLLLCVPLVPMHYGDIAQREGLSFRR